jgi:hypothetical protein
MARLFWEQRRAVGCCLALQLGLLAIFMGLGGGSLQPFNGSKGTPEKLHLLPGANTYP